MADAGSAIDWERHRALGNIDQLRSSYLVVVLVPPLVQLVEMAERTLEQVEQIDISIDVGWRLPIAYFAAFVLATGKLIFDIKAPASIRQFASAQHLLIHGQAVHQRMEPAEAFNAAHQGSDVQYGPVITVPDRETGMHIDILGPSRQGPFKASDKARLVEVTSGLAFDQWKRDRVMHPGWRVATALAFGIGAGLSALLVIHSLWAVTAALV